MVVFREYILIYSKNEQEHKEHLRIILQVIREQQFYAKFSKCDLFKDKIQYLIHVVSKDRISVYPEKINSITNGWFLRMYLTSDHLWGLPDTTEISLKAFLRSPTP